MSAMSHPGISSKQGFLSIKAFLLLCLLSVAGNTAYAQVIWSEEFNTGTTPDTSIWSYDLGANGWGNNELQEYTSASQNVRIEDGNLVITVQKSGKRLHFSPDSNGGQAHFQIRHDRGAYQNARPGRWFVAGILDPG